MFFVCLLFLFCFFVCLVFVFFVCVLFFFFCFFFFFFCFFFFCFFVCCMFFSTCSKFIQVHQRVINQAKITCIYPLSQRAGSDSEGDLSNPL